MAERREMSETDEAAMLDLITRPLSADELAQYESVFGSEQFQDMVRSYHANAALISVRKAITDCFSLGHSYEAMVGVLANVWLDCLSEIERRLDAETEASWRAMPQLLVQVLLQQTLDALNEQIDELNSDFPPEYEEMYKQWRSVMPPAQTTPTPEEEIEAHLEIALALYRSMNDFRVKLQGSELQLNGAHYLEIWTLALLQICLFTDKEQAGLYFLILHNWDLCRGRLVDIVTMMLLLKGSEDLLRPENRAQLVELVYSPEFQQKLDGI